MFPHKYIKLYETQEDYQEALDNHELEEVCVSAIINDREDTPDKYQYSIRTTNNDNERLGPYNLQDPINYFGGLEIIWGYWGWKWEDIEYNGETLHGGHFEAIKETTMYPEIMDGYRLLHINNLIINTPKVTEVGYFDTSNIVSASKAFYRIGIKVHNTDWPKLKVADEMFYELNDNVIQASSDSFKTLSFPELETISRLVFDQCTLSDNYVFNFGKIQSLRICLNIKIAGTNYLADNILDINKYFKGLENCYDYSYMTDCLKSPYSSNMYYTSFIFNPTYTGEKVILLPTFGPHSDINCSKLSTPGGNYLISGLYERTSMYPHFYKISKAISKGLNYHNFENITFEGLNTAIFSGVFNYFEFDEEPFFKSFELTIVPYANCYFATDFLFDCDSNYIKDDTKTLVNPFKTCAIKKDCVLSLKNIDSYLNSNLKLSVESKTFYYASNDGYINLNLNDKSLENLNFECSNLNLTPINNLNINNSGYNPKNITISNSDFTDCNFELNALSVSDHLTTYKISLGGTFDNVNVNCAGYNAIITINPTDSEKNAEGVKIITNNSGKYQLNFTNAYKTPYVKGRFNKLSLSTSVTHINLEEGIHSAYDSYSTESTSRANNTAIYLNFSNYNKLEVLNLGSNWIDLDISHCKLIQPETLYNSIVRRNLNKQGELQLHRVIWDLFTEEELEFIRSKFTVIKIVEDEQSESINEES